MGQAMETGIRSALAGGEFGFSMKSKNARAAFIQLQAI